MTRKKTKKQKIKSASRRSSEATKESVVYSFDEGQFENSDNEKKSIKTKTKSDDAVGNLFGYDPSLLWRDLVKTIMISVLMFVALGMVYFYFNS